MIRGTNVTIGGKVYLMPPANMSTLDRHDEFLQRYIGAASAGQAPEMKPTDRKEMLEIIHEALKRNYSNLAYTELADQLDFGDLQGLFAAAMKASGFEAKVTGE